MQDQSGSNTGNLYLRMVYKEEGELIDRHLHFVLELLMHTYYFVDWFSLGGFATKEGLCRLAVHYNFGLKYILNSIATIKILLHLPLLFLQLFGILTVECINFALIFSKHKIMVISANLLLFCSCSESEG